jgi:DNA-binding NarL/FixJ family response regulator
METNPILLGIADDHVLFRKGLKEILEHDGRYRVIIEASDGKELIDKVDEQYPDIILMDLKMKGMDGMEATKILKDKYEDIKIIALSMFDDSRFIKHLFELGANGYLLKNTAPEEMFNALKQVYEVDYYFTPKISRIIAEGISKKMKGKPALEAGETISTREKEVLSLICRGMTTAEIAEKLFISSRTVEGHRQHLLEKTDTKNSAALVAWAYRNGVVEVQPEL